MRITNRKQNWLKKKMEKYLLLEFTYNPYGLTYFIFMVLIRCIQVHELFVIKFK